MSKLREKSKMLTAYLQYLLDVRLKDSIKIISPLLEEERGCQLSIIVDQDAEKFSRSLEVKGVICDSRKPNVLRLAPVPLYSSFADIYYLVSTLEELLRK